MSRKVTHISVEYYPPTGRATVHIMRQGGNIRFYLCGRYSNRKISMASVKRAMRVQAAMIEAVQA